MEDKYYCIYCGQNRNKGHYKECLIGRKLPKMIMGIQTSEWDDEYNLGLARTAQLTTIREGTIIEGTSIREGGIGTGDKERDEILKYETMESEARRCHRPDRIPIYRNKITFELIYAKPGICISSEDESEDDTGAYVMITFMCVGLICIWIYILFGG